MQKKKKAAKKPEKFTEDDCFICGNGGEGLLICDMGSCPKVYHMACLKMYVAMQS
jgi:hypothetical protein